MKTQSGRSMIEMLGVLAIIGVLSVGGLAGYTRAMRANRANNILDYVNRCFVEKRAQGDGISAKDGEDCAGLTGQSVPQGIDGDANCARAAGGVTTCTVTLQNDDMGTAFAQKLGTTAQSGNHFKLTGSSWSATSASSAPAAQST